MLEIEDNGERLALDRIPWVQRKAGTYVCNDSPARGSTDTT